MRGGKDFLSWLISNWERVLFAIVGLIFLAACFGLIVDEKITEATVLFGLGLLSFIYANLARFKRFKGFGIEAELWEDKQKEAAGLIQQLRGLVATYSHELLMSNVKAGRWGPSNQWADRWKLYDELVGQHQQLGQQIDFSKTKKEMDDYFLFDMTMPEIQKLTESINNGTTSASKKIELEFGKPVRDHEGFNKRQTQLHLCRFKVEDAFAIAVEKDLAKHALGLWQASADKLKLDFDVNVKIESSVFERLTAISMLYQSRPVLITAQLMGWANREE